jgi:hypothetical protein
MQHLREGSVISLGGSVQGPYTYENAVVTNITDAYLEFEWTDPTDSQTYVMVRSWSATSLVIRVVTD